MCHVRALLDGGRLVTLTGVGGCGKTRLAIEIAWSATDTFTDGAWFVDLASLTDAALITAAVAAATGVPRSPATPLEEAVREFLASRRALVVLDNCEHLADACAAFVRELLRHCPDIRILATSRKRLGADGETAWPVPPLALPDPERTARVEDVIGSDSVRLFCDRARAADPAFAPADEDARALALICTRLDGLPLAIELAAARARVLSCAQIAERLDDQLQLRGGTRTPDRQRTLRAAVDWSYELLAERERTALRALGVFAGRFSLEAATAVCAAGAGEIVDVLSDLVEASLVEAETRHGVRLFRLFEVIRQYALSKLCEAGEEDTVRVRHWKHYLAYGQRVQPSLWGAEQGLWYDRLEDELDNFRAALDWSAARAAGPYTPLRMSSFLWTLWYHHSYWTEGRGWLERSLAMDTGCAPAVRASALYGLGNIAEMQRDHFAARNALEEAVRLARAHGLSQILSISLTLLGSVRTAELGPDAARELHEEALEVARESGDPLSLPMAVRFVGVNAAERGEYALAQCMGEESVALSRAAGDGRAECEALGFLANLARTRGDTIRARELYEASLAIATSLSSSHTLGAKEGLAWTHLLRGEYDEAEAIFAGTVGDARRRAVESGSSETGLAALASARGDHERARPMHERILAQARKTNDRLMALQALLHLSRGAQATGNLAAARRHAEESLRTATATRHRLGIAKANERLGDVALAEGNLDEAGPLLSAALESFRQMGISDGVCSALRGLATLVEARGDHETARAYLHESLAVARDMDAPHTVAELAALLDPVATEAEAGVFRRDGDVWTLRFGGQTVRLKDGKGPRYIATLLAAASREIHSSDLVAGEASVDDAGVRRATGRASGGVVDLAARDAYKARIRELDEEMDDARAMGDAVRAERAGAERDRIAHELAAAYGIGGRPRKGPGDPSERARKAVTERIRQTLARIEELHPAMGAHLRESIRTGTFCSYRPARPVCWRI